MTTVADALKQAVTHHQQGRLAEAESLYRRILAKDRLHDEALNLLGVLCHQTGRDAEAANLLQQAIARRKRVPEYHSHLGLALEALGRIADAEQCHQRAIALGPDNASFQNNLGVLYLNSGRAPAALPLFERAAKLRAGYADPYNNIGLARQRMGDLPAARAAFEQAVAMAPNHAVFRMNLGGLLQTLGDFESAHRHLTQALTLRPNYPEAMNNLGLLLQRMGKPDEALALLEKALALRPQYADAMHNQAHTLHALGRLDAAEERYLAALAVEPNHPRARQDLASLRQRKGDVDGAARLAWETLAREPDNREARQQFLLLLGIVRDRSFLDAAALVRTEEMLVALLESDGMAGSLVWPAVASLLRTHAAWAGLPATLGEAHLEALRTDRLLLAMLSRGLAPEVGYESRVTAMRAALLGMIEAPAGERFLELACVVAAHVFLSEYIHEETLEETLAVAALDATLAQGPRNPLAVAVYAAYRPLTDRPWAGALAETRAEMPAPVQSLIDVMITDTLRERALGAAVPALTTIDDEVSRRVRAQYEENPYPRWRLSPAGNVRPWAESFRARFPWLRDVPLPAGHRVLVAGCGTGQQPIRLAGSHPESQIVAIDLSRASLGYAAHKAESLGVSDRIRFGQADLLKLPEADELGLFDRVYATGVLHHMRDPAAGLQALLSRLAPGGIVHLGLYSRIARRRLNTVRAWAAAAGVTPDLVGIRALRAKVKGDVTDADALEVTQFRDFYSASECRDLLLHVQEHQFDTTSLKALLDAAGLEFLAFSFDDPRIEPRFRSEAAEHAATYGEADTALRSLAAWGAFEERHPETFRAMYQFYARRV